MIIGIIGAMEEELRILKEEITQAQSEHYYGYEFITGMIGIQKVILVKSGIGKVNASISAVLLKQLYNVDVIINTGSAGGIGEGLKVGDIVIADQLTHHDVDVTAFGYLPGQMAGMPAVYRTDEGYRQLATEVCTTLSYPHRIGQIVSGDEFVSDASRVASIKENFPKALACEMESAAIAQTAYVLGVPCLIIRAISDSADDDAHVTFDEFILHAGRVSANIVSHLVKKL